MWRWSTELINHIELFDVADLDTALARFEELHPQAARLENAASRADQQNLVYFAARDWDSVTEILADEFYSDDRRPMVEAGIQRGRDVAIANMQATAELGIMFATAYPIATRGERIVLSRARWSGSDQQPDAFHTEALSIVEINTDQRIAARVWFDTNDIDAAFEELDARYLAGEAAAHAPVWQRAIDTLDEANRHEPGPMMTGLAYTDHRRVPFAPGDFGRAVEDLWSLVPDARYRVTKVHALDAHGVVASLIIEGADEHGNELQWARTILLVSDEPRMEVYEESDVDAALAKLEQLTPPASRPENAASRVIERFQTNFAARNWAAIAEISADEIFTDDRRSVVSSGFLRGRDIDSANIRAIADLGTTDLTSTVIATRGERLALAQLRLSGRDQRPEAFRTEMLAIVEIDADNRTAARILFDLDDFDAAIAELEARYLAGEAATHAHAWSAITQSYAVLNRGEIPTTTTDMTDIDHRSLAAIGSGDLKAYLRATFEDSAENRIYIETVHRLTNLGAVVINVAKGTSRAGFYAEWRMICLMTAVGGLIDHGEMYDEADLDTALARFEELHPQAPRLENAASQVAGRFLEHLAAHNWDAMAQMLTAGYVGDDRRRVVGAGLRDGRDAQMTDMRAIADVWITDVTSTVIATRGERLALTHSGYSDRNQGSEAFRTDVLAVGEIDSDGGIVAAVAFDPDDINAAFEELDARYLAGEAAAYARTWSVISGSTQRSTGVNSPRTDAGLGRPSAAPTNWRERSDHQYPCHVGTYPRLQLLHRSRPSAEQPRKPSRPVWYAADRARASTQNGGRSTS